MEIVALIIGWLLGIVSPEIAARIQRPRKRRELSSVLARELRFLRGTMAMVAFRLGSGLGVIDEAFLDRIRPTIADLDEVDEDRKGVVAVKEMMARPTKDLVEALGAFKTSHGRSIQVIPYRMPFLENQISQIGILPGLAQERVLKVQYYLELYNLQAEFVTSQYNLTFNPSIEGENREAILSNAEEGRKTLSERAATLTELITAALGDLEAT